MSLTLKVKKFKHQVIAKVPIPVGKKSTFSPPKTINKGLSYDRFLVGEIQSSRTKNPEGLGYLKTFESFEINANSRDSINSALLAESEMEAHVVASEQEEHKKKKRKLCIEASKKNPDKNTPKDTMKGRTPKFSLDDLVPKEVHRLTGFLDFQSMMQYVIIVCGGNIDILTKTQSKMTWLEEWLLYLTWAYGRVHRRKKDFMKMFGLREETLSKVVKSKIGLVIACRLRWPIYASLEEDEKLRKSQWNDMVKRNGSKRLRLIMHDMSDLSLDNPTDAELNRALYNDYYNGCCGKGGIFSQPCGWEGTHELFSGGIGDSDYIRRSKILEMQQQFQEEDKDLDGEIISFINIFDKGYRVLLDCRKNGKQLCW